MKKLLTIDNLHVRIEKQKILNDLNLVVEPGTMYALMGPNGSGKSSLALTIMGHPRYAITDGSIKIGDTDLTQSSPDQRAAHGLFLAFQYPHEVPGVQVFTFLKETQRALTGTDVPVEQCYDQLCHYLQILKMDESFAYRNVNEGFSGGEKKRFEILQLLMLKPKIAILDEIDSGLDVDALKIVADGLAYARKENPELSFLLITHYQRILEHVVPDAVHVMDQGSIVQSGDAALARLIDKQGYNGRSTAR